jgi:hypothetical protein
VDAARDARARDALSKSPATRHDQVTLRHVSADIVFIAGPDEAAPSPPSNWTPALGLPIIPSRPNDLAKGLP